MINVAEVISDPDLAQAFTVQRSSGTFALGGYQSTTTAIPMLGVVTVATERDLQTMPEGDRIGGAMTFYSVQQIYATNVQANSSGLSDVITWRGDKYRIGAVKPYADYGYYKATGVRMSGE